MIFNYFKTSIRNLRRNRSYALINIFGLAIGIAISLLIFLIVRYEISYDKFQEHYSEIYHVITKDKTTDGISFTPGIPYPALEALRNDFPQIEFSALNATFDTQVAIPNASGTNTKKFIENSGVFFCDPQFFDIFSFKWLIGKPSVLKGPNAVVLTKSVAAKYFGDWKTAVGKFIKIDNALDMKVSGILEDTPLNTDFPVAIMGSFITVKNNRYYGYTTDWGTLSSNFHIYMHLPRNIPAVNLDAQLNRWGKKYYNGGGQNERTNVLQPLSDIHFNTSISTFGDHITSHATLVTLSMIAFLIIVMACINFINLATAQSVTRSKEVGVRKVLGGNRRQLFFQLMVETHILVWIAAIISLLLARLALPYLEQVTSITANLSLVTEQNICFVAFIIIAVTLFAGVYPALMLSGFNPISALKNKINSASIGGISLRRVLVVTQFVITQVLIIGTIVAVSQMDFIRSADLGFNKEAVLILYGSGDSAVVARQKAFKEHLLTIPGVKLVSLCSDVPSSNHNSGTNFAFNHQPDENFTLYMKAGDADYFKTFGLKFIAGEPYALDDTSGKIVINQTLLRKLNLKNPQEAVGREIRTGAGRWRSIAGVVGDFKTNSLREEIKPLMISARKMHFSNFAIKLYSNNLPRSQAAIERAWDKFFPEYSYNGAYMDDNIAQFYMHEDQLALLFKIFAVLAIFISSLGLYGLVSFMAVQKTKEVGIRKVLGAGVGSIVLLFSKEFTWLISVAFIVSTPIAWYFMKGLLDNFAYHVNVGWPVFMIGFTASLFLAWISVGYKAFVAAIANPIKSLRTE